MTQLEKSPLRCATDGTNATISDALLVIRVRCHPAKKNVLLRRIGSAHEPAVLVALQEVFFGGEEPLRVELAIAQVLERPAVKAVGARARDDVDDGAGVVAVGGAVVAGLDAEFLQRVRKREALVLLEIRVRVARAVEPVGVLPLTGAVGRDAHRAGDGFGRLVADRAHHRARNQRLQPRNFAARDRQLDDARVIDDLGNGRGADVHLRRLTRHRDRLRQLTEFERDGQGQALIGRQHDAFPPERAESHKLGRNRIARWTQRRKTVAPVRTRHGCLREPRAASVAVTVAPGITPPLLSVTTPLI